MLISISITEPDIRSKVKHMAIHKLTLLP